MENKELNIEIKQSRLSANIGAERVVGKNHASLDNLDYSNSGHTGFQPAGDYALTQDLENYVQKEAGKGLSTNDFTTEDKTKLDSLENYDDTEIKADIDELDTNKQDKITSGSKLSSDLVDDTGHTNKFVTESDKTTWNAKSDFSGSYNDLTDKPDLTTKEDKSNKVTSLSSSSTNTQYPSAKCVYDSEVAIQNDINDKYEQMSSELGDDTETGTSIDLTDGAYWKAGITPKGNTYQKTYTGKNLLEPYFTSDTISGITVEYTSNGWKVNGTYNGTGSYSTFKIFEKTMKAGTYTINGITGASGSTFQVGLFKNNNLPVYIKTDKNTFTITEDTTIKVNLYCYGAYGTFNNLLLPYQIEERKLSNRL